MVNVRPRPLYPWERPGTHCTAGWVGLRARLDRGGKSRPTGIRSADRPARRQSLYRLSYPAHILYYIIYYIISYHILYYIIYIILYHIYYIILYYIILYYIILYYYGVVSAKIVEARGKAGKKLGTWIIAFVKDTVSAPHKFAR